MMNKKMLVLATVLGLLTLFGCNGRNGVVMVSEHNLWLKPMPQGYRGTLPCADCEGIETSLFLDASGTWVMDQHYVGKKISVASYGSWTRTADKLVLTTNRGEKRYFLAKDDSLVMLDSNGNAIHSPLNYTLQVANVPLPTTPMSMRGEYTYLADAAIFKDCQSGKIYPVDSDAALQNAYLAVRDDNILPVLLQFDAHFIQQIAADSDRLQKVLVTDGQFTFFPGKGCNSK